MTGGEVAVNQQFDFLLQSPGGPQNGYMLQRSGNARSWHRTGVPDIPTKRLPQDQNYGNVSDTLDHPEVIDDWSGGPGEFRRTASNPNAYAWSINMDTRFPGMMIHSQAPQLLDNVVYSGAALNANWITTVPMGSLAQTLAGQGAVLVLGNGYLARYEPVAAASFILAFESTDAPTKWGRRPAIYGSFMYLPNLTGTAWYRRGLADLLFTYSALATVGVSDWFAVSSQQMWFEAGGRGRLRSFTSSEGNLLNGANLGATVQVGNGYFATRDAVALEDQLIVGSSDGMYAGNTTGTFNNVINDTATSFNPENFAALTTHQGYVVGAAGAHIWAFHPSTIQSITREIGPPYLGMAPTLGTGPAYVGRFQAVTSYGRWLYTSLFTGSGSIFWAGFDPGGEGPFTWYPLHDFLGMNVKVTQIHVDGITTNSGGQMIPRRIFAVCDASWGAQAGATAPIVFWPIPDGDDNPVLSQSFTPNFMGSASIETSYDDWQAPGTPKVWRQANIYGSRLPITPYVGWKLGPLQPATPMYCGTNNSIILYPPMPAFTLSYVIDAGAQIALVNATGTGTVNGNIYFNPGGSITGHEIRWRLDSQPTNNIGILPAVSAWPVYRAIIGRGAVAPPVFETIEVKAEVGRPDRRGGNARTNAGQLVTELRDYATGTGPQILTDLVGNTYYVKVQGPIEEEEFWQQGRDDPQVIAGFRMAVLSFSTGLTPGL